MRWWLQLMRRVFLVGVGAIAVIPNTLQAQGSSRVMVQFRLDTALCETVPGAEPCRQSIAGGREALLQELAGTAYQVTRVYDTIPFVAVEVSLEALRILEGSGRVVGMTPDALQAPQRSPDTEKDPGR